MGGAASSIHTMRGPHRLIRIRRLTCVRAAGEPSMSAALGPRSVASLLQFAFLHDLLLAPASSAALLSGAKLESFEAEETVPKLRERSTDSQADVCLSAAAVAPPIMSGGAGSVRRRRRCSALADGRAGPALCTTIGSATELQLGCFQLAAGGTAASLRSKCNEFHS